MENQFNPNLKVTPISVKFDAETNQMVKQAARALGCSHSKLINRTVNETLSQVPAEGAETIPRVILMIRDATKQQQEPPPPWKPKKTKASKQTKPSKSSRRAS